MGTGADVPFHPEHPYRAPYDAAAQQRIAELEGENERLREYWLCADGLTVRNFMAGHRCPDCDMGAEHADAMEWEAKPPHWHEGMRKARPYAMPDGPLLCWRYLAEKTVCILERGHDDGKHEPEGS